MQNNVEYLTRRPVIRGFEDVEHIYKTIYSQGYIAGSYAAYMVAPECSFVPGDIDVFATSERAAHEITDKLCRQGYFIDDGGSVVWRLRHTAYGQRLPVQIICPSDTWQAFPLDVVCSFDLDISRALLLSPQVALCDYNVGGYGGKILKINNPVKTLQRVIKYQGRGVHFPEWELAKLFRAWDVMPTGRKADIYNAIDDKRTDETAPNEDYNNLFDDDDMYDAE